MPPVFLPGKNMRPSDTLATTLNNIKRRKQAGDHLANSMVLKSNDNKSVAVDFLISEGNIVEHNVWRYYATEKGLVSLQIARRHYKDINFPYRTNEFIESIQTQRAPILKELMRADLPISKFAN